MKNNDKKSLQLGIPHGTANARLRKTILFHLLKKHGENICFRCNKIIETEDSLSIEHKQPWLDVSVDLFWDLDNIAFSHLVCNCKDSRRPNKGIFSHPSQNSYRNGCRCDECKKIQSIKRKGQRERGIKT